jgi:hypothetical protein
MSVKSRALVIGLAGPLVQAIGIAWALIHLLVSHTHNAVTSRHIVFESPFLLIFIGFLVSLVCVPLALEVARANQDDVEMPILGSPGDSDDFMQRQPGGSK